MSDINISGIPNMGFGGGGYFANTMQPSGSALSANQINRSIGMGSGGIGDQNQAQLNNLYGAGGFGAQTAHYAGVGAAYGRGTGGFGGYGAANADPFTPVGSGGGAGGGGGASPSRVPGASSPFDSGTSAVPYLSGGGSPFGGGGFGSGGNRSFDASRYFSELTGNTGEPTTPTSSPAGGRAFIDPDIASHPGQYGFSQRRHPEPVHLVTLHGCQWRHPSAQYSVRFPVFIQR
jgi:hypothetical protein